MKQITDIESVAEIIDSKKKAVFYKHSTQCNVSYNALKTLKTFLEENPNEVFIINVIEDRTVSNYLEQISEIRHESPQIIIYENGDPQHSVSHYGINTDFLNKYVL